MKSKIWKKTECCIQNAIDNLFLVTIGFAFICAANALSAGMHGQFHDLLMEMKSEVVNEQVCFFTTLSPWISDHHRPTMAAIIGLFRALEALLEKKPP